jgi:hypothetical protein
MAGLFDFEHYYKEMNIKTDIKLDVSDIPMKSSATSSVMNEDGTIDEVNMNELVTNNVMYKIAVIYVNGAKIPTGSRIVLTTNSIEDDSAVTTVNTYYLAVGYPLDDLVSSGLYDIPETRSVLPNITLNVGETQLDNGVTLAGMKLCSNNESDTHGTDIASVTLQVIPRVRLENPDAKLDMTPYDPSYPNTDQNFWHEANYLNTVRALAGVGLMGSMYKGMKWYDSKAYKAAGVYGYDSFVKMVNNLSKVAKENNLGIKTCFYDRSYMDKVTYTNTMSKWAYLRATIRADWTRTDIKKNAKANAVYGSPVAAFESKCRSRSDDPLPNIIKDGSTALIPTVSDVFKKLYESKEDLAQEFTDQFFETYKSITSIKGVRRFMSSSLKRKLDSAKWALKKAGKGEPQYMLDLASCRNYLEYLDDQPAFTHPVDAVVSHPSNPTLYRNFTNCVRMISEWGFNVKVNTGATADLTKYFVGTYHGPDYNKDLYALHYDTMGEDGYADWQISSSKVKLSEVKQMLCDYYTGFYNAKFNHEEGSDLYVKWFYNPAGNSSEEKYRGTITYDDGTGTMVTKEFGIADYQEGKDGSFVQDPTNIRDAVIKGNTVILYTGTSRAYIDIMLRIISALYQSVESDRGLDYYEWVNFYTAYFSNDDYEISIVDWDSASTASDLINLSEFYPSYMTLDDMGQAEDYTINDSVYFAENVMEEALDEIDTILSVQGLLLGPTFLLIQKLRLRGANSEYAELQNVINRIKWYQIYTNESVFDNKTFIGTRLDYSYETCPYFYMPARFLIPVEMYRRVRIKYRRLFRTRHKTVKRSIGVRWCEVTFVDNDVYEAYPQNSDVPQQFYPIGRNAAVSTVGDTTTFTFDTPIEGDAADQIDVGDVTKFNEGSLLLVSMDGVEVPVKFNNAYKFTSDAVEGIGASVYVVGIYVPLENTAKSDERTKVRVEYKMPYIPYDSELRRWAFMNYGAFDQDKYASDTREVPADPDSKTPGWVIFKNSSKRIGDLRASMGIYDAVAILMGILRNTFGVSCVELVETMRSKDDQELMCSGGGESTFLSWHNYGLAVKILINDPSTGMPIEDGSPQFLKLIDVAEGFTNACYNGAFGKPLNVVWCGRLKLGANNFVWEFLPIGVGHKDAMKFREALLNQEDPVKSVGFVNVDAAGLVYPAKPADKVPYILSSSSSYKNALIINGQHYVSPRNIRNYKTPHDLVLMNVIEFCNLIRTKMQANGSSLNARGSMYEWKTLNDRAYKQLLLYYGLTGSLTAARALVCGEYVETYKDAIDRKYTEDLVEMVKDVLGNLYSEAKVYVEDAADGGAWLTLSDGKLHLKTSDIRPVYTQKSKDNFYGERIAPLECTERGLYIDGVFRNEEWLKLNEAELAKKGFMLEMVSDKSFIDGFKNGKVTGDDALLLHSLVATQIKEEFDKLRELFENYGGSIMYDHFVDGPNASMADMVENEFGLISGQDLIDFDNLRAIFAQKNIEDNARRNSDGTIQGAGGAENDIFEKVVSNAELAGVRKASLTKEHINVTVTPNTMTTEELYRVVMQGSMTRANDMFSKKK